jgi:uncharacterized membrane protein
MVGSFVPAPVRPALLGAATGLRSQIGVAAVLVAAGEEGRQHLPERLQRASALRSALIALATEILTDKTRFAKDRMSPGSLAARLVLAGYAAHALASVEERPAGNDVVVAALSALAAAKVGHDLRALLARRMPDRLVALAEDAVAVALAALAVGADV